MATALIARLGGVLLSVALLGLLGLNGPHVPAQRVSVPNANGCSLFTSVPNPCDPESNN